MFLSRGDRDLGVAFQTHPGRQAFISSGSKEARSALESRRVSLGAHWVDSRNGDESWTAGDTQAITWDYTGNPGVSVKINLMKGGVYKSTIISNTPTADGSYNWKVPTNTTPGSDYKVKVISTANSTIKDDSNANFEIKAPTGTITVGSPNGG